ncbi:MAG: hypothetical protein B7C54_11545 [Acidimicrobiales bacterium mtb01]|nr:SDR family NAD(P)-dependent oxidoreductase [Actinomycetota bacterium]TEX45681.1 MAG: hypothetical protein B7C54_11545 [Acidimicrobiales bacterium mtb01]
MRGSLRLSRGVRRTLKGAREVESLGSLSIAPSTDSVVVVTGAGSGLGQALAVLLAERGCRLALVDIDDSSLAATTAALPPGVESLQLRVDVADSTAMRECALSVEERFGRVDALFNNAGVVGPVGLAWEMSVPDWNWVLGVNLLGVANGVRSFVPMMLRHGSSGLIVNTASVAGLIATPFTSIYTASKHAVVGYSEALQQELVAVGSAIRVVVFAPGEVLTDISKGYRSRPPGVEWDAEQQESTTRALAQSLRNGISPTTAAERLIAALDADSMYALTHREFLPAMRQRLGLVEAGGR